jgi:signal transduction histidine kinase
MAGREKFTLGVRLILVLSLLAVLFAGVVWLTILDSRQLIAEVQQTVDDQLEEKRQTYEQWQQQVTVEHARQLAGPFLLDFESLEGLEPGSPDFNKLQRRMYQFVWGRDTAPSVPTKPVGPLESVVVVSPDYRIVASSDPLMVGQTFTSAEQIGILKQAEAESLSLVPAEGPPRNDGKKVMDLTLAVPDSEGDTLGWVRLRYVGGFIGKAPGPPSLTVAADPSLFGPLLAGIVALLGVSFGAMATAQVISLTRRIEATAHGVSLPLARGPGGEALSLIEERLETLSKEVRRDDLLVQSLSEALREGVVLLDPEGHPVTANRQAVAMLQSNPASDVSNASFSALLELNPELAMIVHQGLENRHPVREKPLLLRLPAGRDVAVQATTYVLRDGERTAGIMIVFKDRQSIETLERNLLEASKLQAIVRLTGSVAHEVKNPLGAIGIHLEHLRRRILRIENADPAAKERVEVLREEIDRLREILDEWLQLTAPEERAPAHADVGEVLDSVARLLRVEARHQGVDLIVDQEGESGRVSLSHARLRQVLLNLALNGLQAMPEGGRLTLRARRDGAFVELRVEDTGSGIPVEVQGQVFDFHFTTREGGSGLGLPICRRLVEAAGGKLDFESSAGRGSVFRVRVPVADSTREHKPEAEEARGL